MVFKAFSARRIDLLAEFRNPVDARGVGPVGLVAQLRMTLQLCIVQFYLFIYLRYL